jgi:hypothetical protein
MLSSYQTLLRAAAFFVAGRTKPWLCSAKMLKGGFFIHQKLFSAIVHWASIFIISFITLTPLGGLK